MGFSELIEIEVIHILRDMNDEADVLAEAGVLIPDMAYAEANNCITLSL